MSRTYRGERPDGYEYWSRRPGQGWPPGKEAKRRTHKIERQRRKREGRDEQ